MAEIILALIVAALLGLIAWERNEGKKERAKWINAFIAKTPEQYRDLELTEKVKPIETPKTNTPPDFVPENEATDEEFKKIINNEVA